MHGKSFLNDINFWQLKVKNQIIRTLFSEKLNDAKQNSSVLKDVHQFDIADSSQAHDERIENVISETKQMLIQDQNKKSDKQVCEWVFMTPLVVNDELEFFLNETENSIVRILKFWAAVGSGETMA